MRLSDAAFLLIDMINEFVHPQGKLFVPGAPKTVPHLVTVLTACREAGLPIIHVARQHRPDGTDVETVRRDAFRHLGGFCLPGSWGAQIVPELAPRTDEPIIIKHSWSSFLGTDLHRHLRQLGVGTLLIGGTQTPNCVRATLYDGTALGYQVILLADGTSAATTKIQEANLYDIATLGVPIVACADIVTTLTQGPVSPHRPRPSIRPVSPAERIEFTRMVLATIREGDLLLDALLRSPFLAWWTYRVLHHLYHRCSQPLVLEVDGVSAGFLVLRRVRAALRIEALGVYSTFRRQGWGGWLLDYAEKEARRLGLKRLELQVSSGNKPALGLYWRAGFFPIPRLWHELWLERPLL